MTLVELRSNNEQLAFLKMLTAHPSNRKHHYSYMGAMKIGKYWNWESSKSRIPFPLVWHKGAPENARGNETCMMALKLPEVDGVKFDDIECGVKMHVMCEKINFYDV